MSDSFYFESSDSANESAESESADFGNLDLKMFRKFSEKISAIHYHKGKIAIALASTYQRIEIWNYKSNKREMPINTNGLVSRCLKFDDTILMSMFEEIRSWDLPSGKSKVVYTTLQGDIFRCCSFDYCKEFNIVVGSFSNSSIYIWNLDSGVTVKRIGQECGLIQKVSVYPVYSDEPQELSTVHLVVLKDEVVDMWTVKYKPSDMHTDTIVTRKCSTVYPFYAKLKIPDIQNKIASSRFKTEFLYYIEASSDILCNSNIAVWDMRIDLLHERIKVNAMIKNLLAVGNKYIALQTEVPDNNDSFVVIDRVSQSIVTASELPKELQKIGADCCPPVIIGESTWLDGLNEENEDDVMCLCVCNRQEVHVLKRCQSGPQIQDLIHESTGYCNLL